MKPSKYIGVRYLLEKHDVTYCGWLAKLTESMLRKKVTQNYGIVVKGVLFLFHNDKSVIANDVVLLSEHEILEQVALDGKYCFGLRSIENELKKFLLGSERELKEWLRAFAGDRSNNTNKVVLPSTNMAVSKSNKDVQLDWTGPKVHKKQNIIFLGQSPDIAKKPIPPPRTTNGNIKKYEVLQIEDCNSCPLQMSEDFDSLYIDPQECSNKSDNVLLPPSVYQWSLGRDGARNLLDSIGVNGMYLIRKGSDERNVISVRTERQTRHYIIFQKNGRMCLHADHPKFTSIASLVGHYYDNNLPTRAVKLTCPYG